MRLLYFSFFFTRFIELCANTNRWGRQKNVLDFLIITSGFFFRFYILAWNRRLEKKYHVHIIASTVNVEEMTHPYLHLDIVYKWMNNCFLWQLRLMCEREWTLIWQSMYCSHSIDIKCVNNSNQVVLSVCCGTIKARCVHCLLNKHIKQCWRHYCWQNCDNGFITDKN